ncbi:MAG: DUF3558 domain-containing protein [Mycobacterium sp.]
MRPTARRLVTAVAVVVSVVALSGCSRAVDGTAVRTGSAASNDNSERQYPNLQRECDVIDEATLAETVGADPLDIQSTFVGAVCRWQAANPAGLIDITRFWYEQGSLENETQTAEGLGYQIETRSIAGVPSIVMRQNDPNGGCGVASDASGVVGWWINPQTVGIDACAQAIALMEMTLATNS